MRASGLAKRIGLLGVLGAALGLGGCVVVPDGYHGGGYYAPAVVAPPVVVAPAPVVIAPRPYYRGYYGWGYRRW